MSLPLFACIDCGSSKNLATCFRCGKPVCPKHRAGFGGLDEYFCVAGCVVPAFDMTTTVVTLKTHKRLKDWQYLLLITTASVLIIAMLIQVWRTL